MELKLNNIHEFEKFVRTYALGIAAREGTSTATVVNTIGGISQTVNMTGSTEQVAAVIRDMTAPPVDNAHVAPGCELFPEQDSNAAHSGSLSIGYPKEDLPAGSEGLTFDAVTVPEPGKADAPAPEAPKRTRRTKAQIAADEAATKAAAEAPAPGIDSEPPTEGDSEPAAEAPKVDPVKAAETAAAANAAAIASEYTPEVLAELNAMAEMFDANRKDHLDEGRTAIQTKGWVAYMATFKGIGQSQNIATYNDAEVKLHRAAIARLLAS